MSQLWNLLLFYPLVNALIWAYTFTGNLGLSIILLTIILRVAMTPLILPSLRMSKKMQELAPELAKLKEEFKDNKQALMTAQADLYKKNGANPASGCLPQILQIVVLIALFNALNLVLHTPADSLVTKLKPILYSTVRIQENFRLSTGFWYLNLAKPDLIRIPGLPVPLPGLFLLLAGFTQFLTSKMMMPEVKAEKKIAASTSGSTDDAMAGMQQQMMYMFPLMTIIFGYQFPSGLVLYWLVFSLVSLVQQYLATGCGGLTPWLKRLNLLKS